MPRSRCSCWCRSRFGVVIVTVNGIDVEQLMEFLFGETDAKMNADKLLVIAVNATISIVGAGA